MVIEAILIGRFISDNILDNFSSNNFSKRELLYAIISGLIFILSTLDTI